VSVLATVVSASTSRGACHVMLHVSAPTPWTPTPHSYTCVSYTYLVCTGWPKKV